MGRVKELEDGKPGEVAMNSGSWLSILVTPSAMVHAFCLSSAASS